nr:kazal-type serine protease inhibitor domain-containing protein 1-like [Paramormyrops kingsleyae]
MTQYNARMRRVEEALAPGTALQTARAPESGREGREGLEEEGPSELDETQEIYGRGGEGLRCRRLGHGGHQREEPEAMCVCRASGSACGSGGCSHPNLCELRKAASQRDTILRLTGQGLPTHLPLRDLKNYTGNDIIFSCKVSAFPLPHLSWRKKGISNHLPGDNPHISVLARGGPQRYTVSTWQQIQGLLHLP